ncbi:MAG TPA: sporulation integral membrane protein YtvI [Desulfobacteria bacterium]|nr:sporulation integral membrane protein YtvI [Desulfobacteria bacterium]
MGPLNEKKSALVVNVNRLVIITAILVALKTVTFFFETFLPVFNSVLRSLAGALFPFIIALLLAFLIEPAVRRIITFLKIKRGYASLLALLLVYGIFGLLMVLVINRLQTELVVLANSFPSYDQIVAYLSNKVQVLQHFVNLNPKVKEALFSSTQGLFSALRGWASAASILLLRVLAALPATFAVILVATIGTYFISADYPRVLAFLQSLFPRSWKNKVQAVSTDLGAALFGYIKAQTTLIGITMVLTIIGLAVLGLEYAVTVGVVTGLLDLLPVVGTGILFVPWILWQFMSGQAAFGIKLLVVYAIILAVRQILEPKILSKNIGLEPLPTLFSMYVGMQLLGGWGLIIGPTLVIVYQALVKAGVFGPPHQ